MNGVRQLLEGLALHPPEGPDPAAHMAIDLVHKKPPKVSLEYTFLSFQKKEPPKRELSGEYSITEKLNLSKVS